MNWVEANDYACEVWWVWTDPAEDCSPFGETLVITRVFVGEHRMSLLISILKFEEEKTSLFLFTLF